MCGGRITSSEGPRRSPGSDAAVVRPAGSRHSMAKSARGSGLIGELSAEFAGTMILILFGVGVVAQVVAGGALTNPPGGLGNHDSIAWAWGLGVTLGVYLAARLSGAHLNPAVTVTLAAFKGFPWQKVAPYVVAQTAGAFVAALLVRWNYTEVLARVDPGPHHQDPDRLLHPARQRQRGRRRARVGRLPRPGHRHRDPADPDPGAHRHAQQPAPGQPRAVHHRPGRGRDRHGVRHGRRVRDQPGA